MLQLNWKKLRVITLAGALAGSLSVAVLSSGAAFAQVRGLPRLTDLVEQVGPSVVNIRTLEKVSTESATVVLVNRKCRSFSGDSACPCPTFACQPAARAAQDEEQPRGVG